MHHGHNAGYIVLMLGHHRGHNDDIGDFADFGGLNVHREAGKVNPASVAGAVVSTEGNQHQQ